MTNVKYKSFWLFGLIIISILGLSLIPTKNKSKSFHTIKELEYFRNHTLMIDEEIDSNVLFPTAKLCSDCHQKDVDGYALTDDSGNDVNMYSDWRSTMMALSAKDPFWRAKVSHEILTNPSHSLDIQTKCTSCHAPMAHYTALSRGANAFTMEQLLQDTIGLDGVSCLACHSVDSVGLGLNFSGNLKYDTSRVAYGPYPNPFQTQMQQLIGFTPIYSPHINDAGVCASCHTLITKTADLNGNYTGQTFTEQATYHEWLNSQYKTQNITCQSCHIPRINDGVVLSDNFPFLYDQMPYGVHELTGANTAMLSLMKNYKNTLGINVPDEDFDSTIVATKRMLQIKSIDLELKNEGIDEDSAFFSVRLINKAGHKFPSGYPSRRAFIQFVVTSENGDTIFKSGTWDSNKEVIGHSNNSIMPHFEIINQENQVQIYELVLGDVNGNFTTVLERSAVALKDNRLPPTGFTKNHYAYDTTQIVGNALDDPDFNQENGNEGTGSDKVFYHIPINGFVGKIKVSASVFYQSLPPKWMAPMFLENSPDINNFKTMFDNSDKEIIIVANDTLNNIIISSRIKNNIPNNFVFLYPNPSNNGLINIKTNNDIYIKNVIIYDIKGNIVENIVRKNINKIILPNTKGVYIVVIETNRGKIIKKVIRD